MVLLERRDLGKEPIKVHSHQLASWRTSWLVNGDSGRSVDLCRLFCWKARIQRTEVKTGLTGINASLDLPSLRNLRTMVWCTEIRFTIKKSSPAQAFET